MAKAPRCQRPFNVKTESFDSKGLSNAKDLQWQRPLEDKTTKVLPWQSPFDGKRPLVAKAEAFEGKERIVRL